VIAVLVALAAVPVILPAIAFVTVRSVKNPAVSLAPVAPRDPVDVILFVPIARAPPIVRPVSVPTDVSDDPVTVAFNVVPVNVPAAAVIVLVVPYVIDVPLIVVALPVPVPPLATFNVPPRVIAPLVADDGVNPVVPPEKVVTPVAEVKNVPDRTFSITPVDVFRVMIS